MIKHLILLILILVNNSCNVETEKEIEITEKFKLEFLNDILSDTINIKILSSKDQLISNTPQLHRPIYISLKNPNPYPVQNFNHVKFISDTLDIKDTLFVKSQFESNESLKLDELEQFGFQIFDMEDVHERQEKIGYFEIDEEIDSINRGKKSSSILSISKPIFNKELNLAYVRIRHGSSGETLILEKENKKWKVKYTIGKWVE